MLDTGSSDMYVAGLECMEFDFCRGHNLYVLNQSTTSHLDGRRFELDYGSGSVCGYLARDNMTMVDGRLVLPNQTFGIATSGNASFGSFLFDGVIGLGFDKLSKYGDRNLFVDNLVSHNSLDPVFAFYFSRHPAYDSLVTFGGYSKDHIEGDVSWHRVIGEQYWELTLDSASLASTPVTNGSTAVMDTGTGLVLVPSDAFLIITEMLQVVEKNSLQFVDCNRTEVITLVIDGTEYSLGSTEYAQHIQSLTDKCVLTIATAQTPTGGWVLGLPFLRKYYTIFDKRKLSVGIAVGKSTISS